MKFTIKDVQSMASGGTFSRGLQYFTGGRARITDYFPEEARLVAKVRGSGGKSYRVDLRLGHGGLWGICTCPVGADCKHSVAAALQWLESQSANNASSQAIVREVPTPLEQWLRGLPLTTDQRLDTLITGKHYLLYQLQVLDTQVRVALKKAYLKKDGQWGQLAHYSPDFYSLHWNPPNFLQPADITTLHLLPHSGGYHSVVLKDEAGRVALEHMLQSNRLLLATRVVRRGPPETLQWQWKEADNSHELQAGIEGREHWRLLETVPPCYLDQGTAEIGDLITTMSNEQLVHLRKMPRVPASKLREVALKLRQVLSQDQLALPVELPELIEVNQPIPCLTLVSAEVWPNTVLPAVLLHFEYAGKRFTPLYMPGSENPLEPLEIDGKLYRIERDLAQEDHYTDQIHQRGLFLYPRLGEQQQGWAPDPGPAENMIKFWQHFIEHQLPELESQGWRILKDDDFSFHIGDAAFDFTLRDEANHWFEFSLALPLSDKRTLDTVEVIDMWLKRGAPDALMVMVEGEWLRIDTKPLNTIRDLITDLYNRKQLSKPVQLPAFQVARLQELANLDDRAAPLTRTLMKQLQDFSGIEPVTVSPRLKADLRPYQQEGLNWLAFLHRYGFGGILADDMGLGKTLQALAFLQHLKDSGALKKPALIIAPTSLTGNWLHEAARFTPDLNVTLIHGPDRAPAFKQIRKSDVVITTYPLLARDSQHYEKQTFSVLILDEAQAIKNPATKVAQQVRSLNSQMRLCLTGTPMENHLGELWSLMDFVLPGLLGGRTLFQEQFRNPIEKSADQERQQALGRRVAPFMLRRSKAQVVKELPSKTEIIQYVELQGKQRALYESIRVSMEKRIRDLVATQGMQRSHIQFLEALLKLRQACIDPRLVKLEKAAKIREYAKLDWLNENLPQLLEEGRSILIFSQFTSLLSLIEADLIAHKLPYAKLTGQTRKRQQAIDLFQNGEVRIFLISLKAGGSGLNLTAADVVIHMDPWWNPAVENQATDRAHRIGQDKPVFVYKLVASNTVEERIQQMQQQKQALADNLFNEAEASGQSVSKEALLSLLSS